ncbi:hypothetical protein [Couchioplanes caeruleus]|uniref:hypothetical protein n=1 Tax=Couchioplanes caeruleus TaxID=56438 RepID=UPI000ABB22B9|nr:hypothetical protein [Couchioplanes caeruleus]
MEASKEPVEQIEGTADVGQINIDSADRVRGSNGASITFGTQPVIPKPKTAGVKGLGKLRYVVEQTFALLHQFRRLAVRWERRLDIHDGFVSLACVLICWRRLINWPGQRSC